MIDRVVPVLYSADLTECAHLASLSSDHVSAVFAWVIEEAGATVVCASSHHFPQMGLTSVLILTESHAVLHTWPESGTVHLDIFSCSSRLKSLAAIAHMGEVLGAADVTVQEVPRADGHQRIVAPSAQRK
jgi:S-adenosylmethionine decarboxylase proenzyme